MKKINLLIICLLLVCIGVSVSAADNASSMLDVTQKLSMFPRGFRNIEIENARELITDTYFDCGLEVDEQIFPTTKYDDNNNRYYGKNIIGTLYPNVEKKTSDVLIIGAHYDGVNDMPSANDNASGVAVLLELAKTLSQYKTDTEIRFVAFDCEELGLLGSKYYADSITDEAENIIGMLNFDMLASKTAGEVFIYSNESENYLYDILKSKKNYQDVYMSELSEIGLNVASDYVSFKPKLIPTLSFSNIIGEETHTEKDVFENISAEMLLYSYNAGLSIVEEIISTQTDSYKKDIDVEEKIYTIPQNIRFPFGVDKNEFEEKLNIKFNPIVSKNDQIQYKAIVNMFDIDEPVELIIEETLLQSLDIDQSITECIVNIDSIKLFDKIYNSLNKQLGHPEIISSTNRETYLWNDLVYGNSYYCVKNTDSIKLYIRECLSNQKGFYVYDGKIIETTDDNPRDTITVFDDNGNVNYMVKTASVLADNEIPELYVSAWEKIKKCLSDKQLSNLKYIILNTDGIGGNIITIEESKPIQYHIDDLLNSNSQLKEKHALIDGVLLIADFMDIIYEKGELYNEKQLEYTINHEWLRRKNGLDVPSSWSIDIIDQALKIEIINSDMLQNFSKPILRVDFCDILYNLFVVKDKNDTNNECIHTFADIDKESVNFFADIGIVNGVEKDLFAPNDFLTREQAATILERTIKYLNISNNYNSDLTFEDDNNISKWAKDSVYCMLSMGIMIGDDTGCFNSTNLCTTEESIVSIMRIYNLLS